MRLGYCLCLCGLLASSAVLAQDIDYGAAAESISAVLADPTFVPYAKPTQKVSEWIAVGDSYSAGTGCNGNNKRMGRDAVPFHAYTSNKVQDLVVHQLKQGDYREGNDLPRNQPFSKPQLASSSPGQLPGNAQQPPTGTRQQQLPGQGQLQAVPGRTCRTRGRRRQPARKLPGLCPGICDLLRDRRRMQRLLVVLLWVEHPETQPGGDWGQQIAIASYINPLGDPASWERLLAYDTNKVSVLVANVLNSPDYVVDDSWKSVIDQAASQGKKILGYVRTGYLGVSQQQFTTRLGSRDLADWASQIEQDIDKW
ncbi:putative spherulin 4 family protein [Aspergillus nidulans FGSC A4]|uniref:SGNH hydrolase-type esterase domain-containing protein n=1 Tax=Emericella nidulans (strain FGSC A4 / ATCC 38163 / CBS 112.46 / NRRL 194 / M139) TaxID=227321 RepID=C8VDA1_EMENI|nr:hypothetical protein [Aspergillus nidulans FGSC A4]CBF79022.1 TPA: conserved hypothetical protein [Aspergillus nidulans FGSC A4]